MFNRISGTTAISGAVDSSHTLVETQRGNGRTKLICITWRRSSRSWSRAATVKTGKWCSRSTPRTGWSGRQNTFSRRLRWLYDENGFPREFHPHTLRHYFMSTMLHNGVDKQTVA